jgi:hypothetical protein
MKLTRATFLHFAGAAALLTQVSCSSGKPMAATFPIGQKVQVGKLFYQVIEAQWITDLKGAKTPPKNRILQLQLTITNSGAVPAALPFLRLIDGKGNEIMEVSDLDGNPRWMGALRRMEPALTEEGFVYFDVPVAAYKLEVVDNSNADDERVAYIEIPASLAPPPPPPGGATGI